MFLRRIDSAVKVLNPRVAASLVKAEKSARRGDALGLEPQTVAPGQRSVVERTRPGGKFIYAPRFAK